MTAPLIKYGDLIWVNTATTGIGTVTLGAAVSGYLSFANGGVSDGDKVTYTLHDGANSEIGRGTYTASGTTLSRDTIYHSTNGNAAITLSGNATVTVEPAQTDYKLITAMGAGIRMVNGTVVASVAASAMTLAIKTLAGNDPGALDPVILVFRNSTLATGDYLIRRVEAALSITIPSGATLGHVSARDQQIILGAIDNAGTVELFVGTAMPDEAARQLSTTTISGSATSSSVAYSTTGRSNRAWIPVARCVSNQTTAGTWTATPTKIDLAPFVLPTNVVSAYLAADQTGIATSTFTKITVNTIGFDPDGVFDNATNYRFQPKVPGKYLVGVNITWSGASGPTGAPLMLASIFKNGSDAYRGTTASPVPPSGPGCNAVAIIDMNGTGDFLELHAWQNTGSSQSVLGGLKFTHFDAYRIAP